MTNSKLNKAAAISKMGMNTELKLMDELGHQFKNLSVN